MKVETRAGLPIIAFKNVDAFETWLAAQPANSRGMWLKLAKKGSGIPSLSRNEAIDAALCCGWIDGQLDPYNDACWLVRFKATPIEGGVAAGVIKQSRRRCRDRCG